MSKHNFEREEKPIVNRPLTDAIMRQMVDYSSSIFGDILRRIP